MKKVTVVVLSIMIYSTSFVVIAADPFWYPKGEFKVEGVISTIDMKRRVIVVSDMQLSLASIVTVHSKKQQYSSLSNLQVGDMIGMDIIEKQNQQTIVTEIWIINKRKGAIPVASENEDPGDAPSDGGSIIKRKGVR